MGNSALAHWLKIGEVANYTGLPVKTIRYYQDLSLLTQQKLTPHQAYFLAGKNNPLETYFSDYLL